MVKIGDRCIGADKETTPDQRTYPAQNHPELVHCSIRWIEHGRSLSDFLSDCLPCFLVGLITDHRQPIAASSCSERYTAGYCGDAVSHKRRGGGRIATRTALPLRACLGAGP